MKPVYFFLFRQQNVKAKEFLFFPKLPIFQNGNQFQEIILLKIMYAKDILLIRSCLEVENLT